MENHEFKHYQIPFKNYTKSKRFRPPPADHEGPAPAYRLTRSKNVEDAKKACSKRELVNVAFLGSYDWYYFSENSVLCNVKLGILPSA